MAEGGFALRNAARELTRTVNYTETALRQLRKLDKAAARRIRDFMDSRVAARPEPRSLDRALTG